MSWNARYWRPFHPRCSESLLLLNFKKLGCCSTKPSFGLIYHNDWQSKYAPTRFQQEIIRTSSAAKLKAKHVFDATGGTFRGHSSYLVSRLLCTFPVKKMPLRHTEHDRHIWYDWATELERLLAMRILAHHDPYGWPFPLTCSPHTTKRVSHSTPSLCMYAKNTRQVSW